LLTFPEDREIEIVHDLAQRVLEHEVMLTKVSDILGELDWYESDPWSTALIH